MFVLCFHSRSVTEKETVIFICENSRSKNKLESPASCFDKFGFLFFQQECCTISAGKYMIQTSFVVVFVCCGFLLLLVLAVRIYNLFTYYVSDMLLVKFR